MILSTCETVPGREIKAVLGLVKGNSVRGRHAGIIFLAGMKNLVGGEIQEYTKLMAESREQAIDRLSIAAEELGADAVVGVRITSAEIQQHAAEILVYGTAVQLR
jgi:uncharacterized protein YbjQ (UPF0145 family)